MLYLDKNIERKKETGKKKFPYSLVNLILKTTSHPSPESITSTYSNPGRDLLNKTTLLLVKSENKGCLHAEQGDDYQTDTVWATCQHYTVKKKKNNNKKHTFPPHLSPSQIRALNAAFRRCHSLLLPPCTSIPRRSCRPVLSSCRASAPGDWQPQVVADESGPPHANE